MRSVCVFCGSSLGGREAYADAARALGQELVNRGLRMVYGGAHVGLMGVLADTDPARLLDALAGWWPHVSERFTRG